MTLHRNLIAGEWTDGEPIANVNPSNTDEEVGRYARATAEDAERAIAAAKEAFPAWSRSGPAQRHAVLRAASDEIAARKEEIGRLLAREEGKTLAEGIMETARAAQIFDFFAGEALQALGRAAALGAPGRDGRDHPRAGGRGGPHHAVELPRGDPGLEARAGALPRQHGGHQARRPRAGLHLGAGGHPAPRGAARGGA